MEVNLSAVFLPEAKYSIRASCFSPAKTPTPVRHQRHCWNVESFEPSGTLSGDAPSPRRSERQQLTWNRVRRGGGARE